jgi:hypothetical protein
MSKEPKQSKGGVFAPSDLNSIKAALGMYVNQDISEAKQRQIANLLHRLNNRI